MFMRKPVGLPIGYEKLKDILESHGVLGRTDLHILSYLSFWMSRGRIPINRSCRYRLLFSRISSPWLCL